MDNREAKTLAELSTQDLLDELQARTSCLVLGAIFPADGGKYRVHVHGDALQGGGLAMKLYSMAQMRIDH